MVSGLKAHAGSHRVALILSNGKTARIRETTHRIASEEQSANDWSLPNSDLIRIADVTGETAPAGNLGEEARIEIPRWGRFSGYVSYANQIGIGQGPIVGVLFLGSDAVSGLTNTSR